MEESAHVAITVPGSVMIKTIAGVTLVSLLLGVLPVAGNLLVAQPVGPAVLKAGDAEPVHRDTVEEEWNANALP